MEKQKKNTKGRYRESKKKSHIKTVCVSNMYVCNAQYDFYLFHVFQVNALKSNHIILC